MATLPYEMFFSLRPTKRSAAKKEGGQNLLAPVGGVLDDASRR